MISSQHKSSPSSSLHFVPRHCVLLSTFDSPWWTSSRRDSSLWSLARSFTNEETFILLTDRAFLLTWGCRLEVHQSLLHLGRFPPPPFRENQLWKPAPLAHSFQRTKVRAPPLRMCLNFFILRISRAPQPQQPCTAEQFVGRAAKKQASEPPAETHWGKKNKGWVGQAQAWPTSTHEKNKRYLKTSNQQCSRQTPNPLP